MERNDLEIKSPECDHFGSHLLTWPIVASAFGQVSSLYASTKEKNRFLKKTMETAESGVGAIVSSTSPVLSKPMSALNGLACERLEKLEQSFPVVLKPTDEVVKATKDLCNSAVQPLVERVASAKQYGCDTVSGVRTYTGETLISVKNYGLAKADALAKFSTDQVSGIMGTAVGQPVVHAVEGILDVADHYVDDYLPPEEEPAEKAVVPEHARGSQALSVVATKAVHLASKVRQRTCSRVLKQMKHVQLKSRETLGKLNYTVDLIEYARSNFDETAKKMHSVWEVINRPEEEEVAKDEAEKQTTQEERDFEQKAIATARHLTTKLRNALSGLRGLQVVVGSYPQIVTTRIHVLQEKAASLANIFSKETTDAVGLPQAALDSARNFMKQIYTGLFDLVSVVPGYETLHRSLKLVVTNSEESSATPSEESTENEKENCVIKEGNE